MDIRRDKLGNVVRGKPKTNGRAKKLKAPKVLATIADEELVLVKRTLNIIADRKTELSALEKYYHQITVELAQKYELPGSYSIDWNDGKITEVVLEESE